MVGSLFHNDFVQLLKTKRLQFYIIGVIEVRINKIKYKKIYLYL